jgi:hypothetical protein
MCKVFSARQTQLSRLSRYDETGLIWLLEGRKVLALTAETAAIHNPSGSRPQTAAHC